MTDLVGVSGRETFLVKVDWADDWPVFNEGRNITLLTRGRESLAEREPGGVPLEWQADLKKPDLELGWYQKSKWSPTCPMRPRASGPCWNSFYLQIRR